MEKFIPDPARLQAVEENWKRILDRVQEGAVKSGRFLPSLWTCGACWPPCD